MRSVFDVAEFQFPYTDLKFPGQASNEKILYITREAPIMLYIRVVGVGLVSLVFLVLGLLVIQLYPSLPEIDKWLILGMSLVLSSICLVVGWWWMNQLWRKSLFVLTTRRLTKYIYTTPWNRYNLSLGLDKIVDTGAYARGYFQAMFGIGTLSARSSAGNRAEKYFYIENIQRSEDLKHYIGKVLFEYAKDAESLTDYRPFLPWLKGEARKRFMKDYPHYWS